MKYREELEVKLEVILYEMKIYEVKYIKSKQIGAETREPL
jgi:hypothetical protein